MIITTIPTIPGREITEIKGIVTGETVVGIHFGKDIMAGIRNIVGGRSDAYEKELRNAMEVAMDEMGRRAEKMGANAVVGTITDSGSLGGEGGMLMVTVTGTAVVVR